VIAKLLVANRGEIAARVLRTARAMGIATVAVFSDPDRDAPFVGLADEAVPLGGAAPADSYLRAEAILDAAEATGADAVHPGYGFLAERAEFAAGCRKRGLLFVGPPPEVLAALGDKLEAKRAAAGAGVPVLPGVSLSGVAAGDLAAAGERVGFPLLVKAVHGGGGIGMRVVRDPGDLPAAVDAARRQAEAAFGSGEVFLERWLEAPRHVEVQLLADAGGRMAQLFERECSVQRRHQKLVEEAPSPAVGPALRRRLGEAALAVARAVDYVGAGTVEFLVEGSGRRGPGHPFGVPRLDEELSQGGAPVDRAGEEFWFLEVNARIQVEHPVTEAVTGLDLVRLQLLIAAGEPLPPEVSAAEPRGHAIAARLYAEDPSAGFLPQAGVLHRFRFPPGGAGAVGPAGDAGVGAADGTGPGPGGWGVRVDAGVADGSVVGVHYDPLLAKVVAHAPTRAEAARVLAAALAAAQIHGIVTNRDLLVGVLRSEAFLAGETDTAFLDRHPPAELTEAGGSAGPHATRLHAAAAALAAQARRRSTAAVYPAVPSGWRNNPSQLQRSNLSAGTGATVSVAYRFDRTGALASLEVDGAPIAGPGLWGCTPDQVDLEVEGVRRRFEVHLVADIAYVDSPLGHSEFRDPLEGRERSSPTPASPTPTRPGPTPGTPTPGTPAPGTPEPLPPGIGAPEREGSRPASGARAAVHSPAGMDGAMVSPLPGVVRRVAVRAGERVEAGAVLVVVEAMKTEHRIAAPRAGTVRRVLVAEGHEVAAGATVVELEEPADG
jgi:propionyl-CoA carboxylase alpha chain